jgi:hypothetical protein
MDKERLIFEAMSGNSYIDKEIPIGVVKYVPEDCIRSEITHFQLLNCQPNSRIKSESLIMVYDTRGQTDAVWQVKKKDISRRLNLFRYCELIQLQDMEITEAQYKEILDRWCV